MAWCPRARVGLYPLAVILSLVWGGACHSCCFAHCARTHPPIPARRCAALQPIKYPSNFGKSVKEKTTCLEYCLECLSLRFYRPGVLPISKQIVNYFPPLCIGSGPTQELYILLHMQHRKDCRRRVQETRRRQFFWPKSIAPEAALEIFSQRSPWRRRRLPPARRSAHPRTPRSAHRGGRDPSRRLQRTRCTAGAWKRTRGARKRPMRKQQAASS